MERELQGKTALVTGGRKGIGRALVEKMAQRGASLIVTSHTPTKEFEMELTVLSEQYQIQTELLYFDIGNSEEIDGALKQLARKRIDVLVNCAGVAQGGTLGTTSIKTFKETFNVNFLGVMQITQYIQRLMMRQRSGSIINIGSVSGCENYGGNISYGASKAALIWATKELSKELAPFGIRVNCVSPGTTETDMVQTRTKKQMDAVLERIALKRMASAEEIAEAVLFLASDRASYITGHNLIVDGGRLNY